VTLTTGNGTRWLSATQSFNLQTTTGSNGMTQVLDQNGTNITSSITAAIWVEPSRRAITTIPGLLNQLDTLANQFGTAFNAAQASGYDQNGNAGQNFLHDPPAARSPVRLATITWRSPIPL
jgi:flagellar hook-associated protein 1